MNNTKFTSFIQKTRFIFIQSLHNFEYIKSASSDFFWKSQSDYIKYGFFSFEILGWYLIAGEIYRNKYKQNNHFPARAFNEEHCPFYIVVSDFGNGINFSWNK